MGGVGNSWQILEDSEVDFSPYSQKRIRLISGASAGAVGWLSKVNPESGGVDTIRTTRLGTINLPSVFPTLATPTAGNEYIIEDITKVSSVEW